MGRQIKGLLYFYWTDIQFSLMVFWSILLAMLTVSVSMMFLFPSIDFMSFSFTVPIYIFCAIIGFLMAKHTIAYGIKLGATRKNIYISMGIFFVVLALMKSTIAALIQGGVMKFILQDDMNFLFAHPMNIYEDTILNRIYTDFFIIIFVTTLTFLISLSFHKLGLLVSGLIIGMIIVLFTYSLFSGELITYLMNSFQNSIYLFFAQFGLVALITYLVAWLLLRKITVVAKK